MLLGAVDVLVQVIAGTNALVAVGEGFCHRPTLVDLATRAASSGMNLSSHVMLRRTKGH